MKQLSWKLILPLTIISFTIFTKWWFILPVDAPDSMMYGFPLPYVCNGWHTSMSLQIFIIELIGNLIIYSAFWFIITWIINRYLIKIKMYKIVTILLLSMAGLNSAGLVLTASNPDNIYYFKRPFNIDILETGYRFLWDKNSRPENFNFKEYKRNKNKNN